MTKNNSFNQGNKNFPQPLKEITEKIRKQAYQAYITWFIVILGLTVIYYFLLKLPYPPIRSLIHSLVLAAVTVDWIISIPFLGIMILIVVRTRSKNFFYQLFPSLILLILVTIVALNSFINITDESPVIILYILALIVLIVLEAIFIRLQVQGIKNNKKPLFFWTFFQDTLESYASSLLSQQALQIDDHQNGYSQRPYFQAFSELEDYCDSLIDFQSKMEMYAKFLIEKSELVGWDTNNSQVILYPRVLLGHAEFGIGLRYLWDLFIKICRKQQTNITIDYELKEISIHIAPEDYHLLGDVTYYLLGKQIIERFKLSVLAFIEGESDQAYSILFPLQE